MKDIAIRTATDLRNYLKKCYPNYNQHGDTMEIKLLDKTQLSVYDDSGDSFDYFRFSVGEFEFKVTQNSCETRQPVNDWVENFPWLTWLQGIEANLPHFCHPPAKYITVGNLKYKLVEE
jgi:hypothetical protein